MPNTALSPQELKKIIKQISSDQQLLEQLTPELLSKIQEQSQQILKMYEQSQQTINKKDPKIVALMEQVSISGGTAIYNKKIQFFTQHEIKNAVYRYTKHIFLINGLSKITPDLNLRHQLKNILEMTRTRTFRPRRKIHTLPNTTLTPKDLEKITKEIFNDQEVLEQLVPEILPTIVKNQEQEMYKKSRQTTNTNNQTIMDLMQKVTTPPFALLNNDLIFFTPHEIKNTILRYEKNITKINNLTKITNDANFLKYLTNILDFIALARLVTPFH